MDIQSLKIAQGPSLTYLIKEPKTVTSKNKAIILLHGVGSNEQDLFGLAEHLPEDFYIISLRGPVTFAEKSYGWYNVDFSSGKPQFDPAEEKNSRKLLALFLKEIKEKLKLEEVYLGGFSQGAIMSYNIGLLEPSQVTGIFCIGGRILQEIRPGVASSAALRDLKVFIAHGVSDGTLPVQHAREAKSYLERWHVKLFYREYAMGHQITQDVLNDLNAWLK